MRRTIVLPALHDLADINNMQDIARMKRWNMTFEIAIGLAAGALLSSGSYVPNEGILQHPQLLIVSVAIAIVIVWVRNRRKEGRPLRPRAYTTDRTKAACRHTADIPDIRRPGLAP